MTTRINHLRTAVVALSLVACLAVGNTVQAAPIAGLDFENGVGGSDSIPDDLNLLDGISVSGLSQIGTGSINCCDGGAQSGRTSFIGRVNGPSNLANPGVGGAAPADGASFSITIPNGVVFDLENVSWESSQATGSDAGRWIAFKTSLDATLLHSAVSSFRPTLDAISVPFNAAAYKNLTNTTIDFQWYSSGGGSGDSDIDNILIEGSVVAPSAVPEPSTFVLSTLGLLSLSFVGWRRRRR